MPFLTYGHHWLSDGQDSMAYENKTTFILSNIALQISPFNRKSWLRLEYYARTLVVQGNKCYVVAGTAGKGDESDISEANCIVGGKLSVPTALWKVIVVLAVASNDINGSVCKCR
ncbi:hypothetical protein GCM10028774_65690 [Spirosoma jeollabukense]